MSAFFVPHLVKGRRFLVTGATGGAGSRVAIELSRCGGVCTLAARDVGKAEKVLRELMGTGHSVVSADLGGAIPPFDGIFHAAGQEVIAPLALSSAQRAAEVFGPSVDQAVDILAHVGSRQKSILKDGGSVVFMSSVAAVRGQAGMALYCASKGAMEALARAAAVELAPRRIRVNCIRAGAFDSPMHRRILQRTTPESMDAYASRHLLGFGKAEDIAHAALYLLSDASRWVTGTELTIDGGFLAK